MTGRKVWFITGAGRGMGVDIAKAALAAGNGVVATGRNPGAVARAVGESDDLLVAKLDVTNRQDAEAAVQAAVARFGRIDVLVNNAGAPGAVRAEDESADDFARVLDVNLVAPFHLARLLAEAPVPERGRTRSVVNVSSILALVSGAPLGGAAYAASKAGLVGLTRELAGQWGRSGVRVNALAPGWFRSEMTDGLFSDERSRAVRLRLENGVL